MKTYAEHIKSLQDTRKDKSSRMKEIHQLAADEGRTLNTAESEEFDTIDGEIKSINVDIARTERMQANEADEAATAKAVSGEAKENAEAGTTPLRSVPVQAKNTQKLEPGIGFARLARVKALSFTGQAGTRDEAQIAKSMYPGDDNLYSTITKAAVPAASTTNSTWAGNLINEGGSPFADFVEFLRSRSIYGQISSQFRHLPFDTPVLVQSTGGTASWVGEGQAKPLTQWTYARTKLAPLKVAAIAAATKETLMRASVAADTFLRDELARSVGATIDTTLISAAAAVPDESPAGLLNGTNPLTLGGAPTSGATAATIRCDIAQFLKELVGDNLTVAGSFWVMSETVAISLSLATNEVGAPAFPGATPTGGTLAGLPVFTSQYIGNNTAGPIVALIRGDEIFLGDEGGLQVSVSDQASLQMVDAADVTQSSIGATVPTTSVSMFQTNSVAFLVERFVNWKKRRSEAVVWAGVDWDSCA